MKQARFFAAIAAILPLVVTASAHAVEQRFNTHARVYTGTQLQAAARYLQDSVSELRLEGVDLATLHALPSGSSRVVRLEQRHRGVVVFDAGASVRVTEGGAVRDVQLEVKRGLSVDVVPNLSEDDARAVARTALGAPSTDGMQVTLGVIGGDEEGAGQLIYRVDVPFGEGGTRVELDAHSGDVLSARGLAVYAKGRVYKISAVNTPDTSDEELPNLDTFDPQRLVGFGGLLGVYEYKSGSSQQANYTFTQDLGPSSGADFLYDPPADKLDKKDSFAYVNTYYHVARMRNFWTDRIGLDMSAAKWSLGVIANATENGQPMDNAFYAPMTPMGPPANKNNMVVIGQGSKTDFAVDSDVFLHEMTHYISFNAINYNQGQLASDSYGLSPFGGSIDEGISDYFACTLNGDPILGEASLAPLGFGAARDLSEKGRICPDSLLGEVHEDGKLIGAATWAIHELLGADLADPIIFAGWSTLQAGTSFSDFADGVTQAAKDFMAQGEVTQEQVDGVIKIFADHGLDDCGRVLALDDKPRKTQLIGLDMLAGAQGASCQQVQSFISLSSLFHFSAKTTADTKQLKFKVKLESLSAKGLNWDIYVREGKHVSFKQGGGFVPVPTVDKYDAKVTGITTKEGEIVVDTTTMPALNAGATYYMVIVHRNCPITKANVSAEVLDTDPGAGGAGGGAGAGGGTGEAGAGGEAAGGNGGEGGGVAEGGAAGSPGSGGSPVLPGGTGGGGSTGAGTAGTAGSPAMATGGSTPAPATAGSGGSTGGSTAAGTPAAEGTSSEDGGGCGCRVAGESSAPRGAALLAIATVAGVARRRRRAS